MSSAFDNIDLSEYVCLTLSRLFVVRASCDHGLKIKQKRKERPMQVFSCLLGSKERTSDINIRKWKNTSFFLIEIYMQTKSSVAYGRRKIYFLFLKGNNFYLSVHVRNIESSFVVKSNVIQFSYLSFKMITENIFLESHEFLLTLTYSKNLFVSYSYE